MTQERDSRVPQRIGFTGKIPSSADFVKQHIGNPIDTELERWLDASAQNLYHGKIDLAPECIRFVFSAPGCESIAYGCLRRSSDRVGRSYPLAIYSSLGAARASACLAGLPRTFEGFFAAAQTTLQEASNLQLEDLRDRVVSLRAASEEECAAALDHERARAEHTDASEMLRGALSDQHEDAAFYALYTLCAATEPVRAGPAGPVATVLDCPLEAELGPALWLDLLAGRLTWPNACPSFIWTAPPRARLLIALGNAPDQMLSFVANPKHPSARLWPLITQNLEATARARTSLENVIGDIASSSGPRRNLSQLAAAVANVHV